MAVVKPRRTLDASLPPSAASDAHRARPRAVTPQRPRYTGRMPAWAWLVVIGLCLAATLPVMRSSSVTESGAELRALEAERERLNSEIRSLTAHVGEMSSLARVKEQAEARFNMVHARPTVTLAVEQQPPTLQLPARLLPLSVYSSRPAESVPAVGEAVWQSILDALIFD